MPKSIFNPTIEDIDSKYLFGNWMALGREISESDYTLVWAALAARIRPIASLVQNRYGLGAGAKRGQSCPYWTAVELAPGAPVPAGMVSLVIPPGPYLVLTKDQRMPLGAAYDFIYNAWEHSQKSYVINRYKLCLENYGPVGQSPDEVKIFVPLADSSSWSADSGEPPCPPPVGGQGLRLDGLRGF